MVYKILIRLKPRRSNDVLAEYEARNLGSFSYDVTIPTSQMALPEFYKEGAILVKAEGNTGKMVFTWTIKDEDTVPFNKLASWDTLWYKKDVDGLINEDDLPHTHNNNYLTDTYYSRKLRDLETSGLNIGEEKEFSVDSQGNQIPTNSIFSSRSLKLADTQMIALSEIFEKRGISTYERHEIILRNSTDNYNIWVQEGVISRLSFQKQATDPVTWNATIELTVGDVIASTA